MNFRLPYPNVFSSLPDFAMGLAFLATWIEPDALGEGMVVFCFQVMLLEFIIIHSAGFMGSVIYGTDPRPKKFKILLGLTLFYFIFVAGFALSFASWWPVVAFAGLMFNRLMSAVTGQAEEGKEQEFIRMMWGVNVGCYLIAVFAVILIPVPELGVTPDELSHLKMSGEFVDEPHRMIAWGFLYFMMVGFFELKMRRSA